MTTSQVNSSLMDAHPFFSFDGSRILFQSPRANGVDTNIYVMNSDGSNVVKLTNLKGFAGVPVYSPDEKLIGFQLLEKGTRRVPEKLARKAATLYGLSAAKLTMKISWHNVQAKDDDALASDLAALGYPGLSYLKSRGKRNPAEVSPTANSNLSAA